MKYKTLSIRKGKGRLTLLKNACLVLFSMLFLLLNSCRPIAPHQITTTTPKQKPVSTGTALPATTPILIPTATLIYAPHSGPLICSPLAIQPLDKFNLIITQPFIMPRVMDDGSYKDSGHHGLDIGFITRGKQKFTGSPVLAAIDGKVVTVIHNRPPYGDMVMLETPYEHIPAKLITDLKIITGDSLYTVYGHLQNIQPLTDGQEVKCGHQIAETGLTGMTDGPHLHFETRWGPPHASFPVMAYYINNVTEEEVKYYTIWRMSGKYQLFDPFKLLKP